MLLVYPFSVCPLSSPSPAEGKKMSPVEREATLKGVLQPPNKRLDRAIFFLELEVREIKCIRHIPWNGETAPCILLPYTWTKLLFCF